MQHGLKVLLAQINITVGAVEENTKKIVEIIQKHQATHDLIIFPELAITGYPPEDLLLRPLLLSRVKKALLTICEATQNTHVVIGHPHQEADTLFNALTIIHQGNPIYLYKKQHLPNTGVFDEKRYFEPGTENSMVITLNHHKIAFCICEDLWQRQAIESIMAHHADILVCINASPFEVDKFEARLDLLKPYQAHGMSLIYVNLVGGQDELVFDGRSFVLDSLGQVKAQAPAFIEASLSVEINTHHTPEKINGPIAAPMSRQALTYEALKTGLFDYVTKNNFPGVLLGLSGGVDSALVLALAVDALGAHAVHPLLLPSRYTADMSVIDAQKLIENLNIPQHNLLSIEAGFDALLNTLKPTLPNQTVPDITAQNIQARLRGTLLMAYSNTLGKLVLSTSNKSESAVGYTTLYGDMCGGFAPIKDVPKTWVYQLCEYRNSLSKPPVIPKRILTRAPSAELAHEQTDQDTLPDYEVLDAIIALYMNEKLSIDEICAQGFELNTVEQVVRLIQRNEYKRRQAAPGTKITKRAFGRDWRYPITSKFL